MLPLSPAVIETEGNYLAFLEFYMQARKYHVWEYVMFGIHRCGFCVGGQTGWLETEGLDSCAVCGGDDSCVGCDNVVGSNKMSDACGACLTLEDESRDSKC